tara:strand:- start:170 stop:1450 length:1281 start_codon:yes stop_codon:yes gene_type:complete
MSDIKAIKRAEFKMANGRKFVIKNECFFATILLNLRAQMIEGGTMGTDGTDLLWSWKFVDEECNSGKVAFVLIHEILHVVCRHHLRRGQRDPDRWNRAADYFINLLIIRMGLNTTWTDAQVKQFTPEQFNAQRVRHEAYRMPQDGLLDTRFAGANTGEIYDILTKEDAQQEGKQPQPGEDGQPGEGNGSPEPCPWGNVEDATGQQGEALGAEDLKDAERDLAQVISIAAGVARGRGQLPGALGDAIQAADREGADWKDVLRDYITEATPNDINFSRRNRRHLNSPCIVPGRDLEGLGHVCFMTDASGSVTAKEFSQFMGDGLTIIDQFDPEKVTLIQFDWNAADPEELDQGETPKQVRLKSGGTRFRAPFERAERDDILGDFDLIILFTDGGDDQWPEEPDCPVIWASTGAFHIPPPFGQCVQVKF